MSVSVSGLEAARGAHEFREILDPRFALVALFLLVVLDEAARLDHVIDLLMELEALDLAGEPLDEDHELADERRLPSRRGRSLR